MPGFTGGLRGNPGRHFEAYLCVLFSRAGSRAVITEILKDSIEPTKERLIYDLSTEKSTSRRYL